MKLPTIITAFAAVTLVSCNSKDNGDADAKPPSVDLSLQAVLLASVPDGAVTITEARKNPTPGTEVVISGKIMGKMDPFVKGRALLTLGDPSKIVSCDLMPEDSCETPWDVCCDDPATIAKSIVAIQVLGDDGRPLKHGLKGLGGMRELSSLVVKGTVAEGSSANNLLINATGIHIAMIEPTKENPAKPQP